MNDSIHRILSGSPLQRKELVAAGIFVAIWFIIDVIQFSDWLLLKLNPVAVMCLK